MLSCRFFFFINFCYTLNMNYQKKILQNGVRFITIPMPASPTATIMVLVEAGSKYETKKVNGVSHFLEHFLFKGTARRPKPSDISRELDALGAQYNAFTSQESTGYFAKAHKDKIEKITDIVADMYLNPSLPAGELEKEKGVIIQEINMYEDEPMRHVQDVFMELLYGDAPAGWNVAGTKESVAGLTVGNIAEYRRMHYVAEATTVVVSGAFDEAAMEKYVRKVFENIPATKKPEKAAVVEEQKSPAILIAKKETDQAHLVLGVRAFGVFDSRVPALRLLATILGGGMSSRLFVKLREELGLCYYVSASPDFYTDHGVFQIAAGVDTARVSAAMEAIMTELRRLAAETVPAAEIRKAKDFLIGNLYLSLESSDELASFYGGQEVLRQTIKTPETVADEIEAISSADILDLARRIFISEKLNLALIGPFDDKKTFEHILKF